MHQEYQSSSVQNAMRVKEGSVAAYMFDKSARSIYRSGYR